jgi:hypothetical protein
MTDDDQLLNMLTSAISEDENVATDVVITNFVVIAEFMDDTGERRLYTNTLEGQSCHTTLGLLVHSTAIEQYRAADSVFGDDEDGNG